MSLSQIDINGLITLIKKLSKLGVVNKADLKTIEVFKSKLELSLNYLPNLIAQ
jgi:hypothetical protein